MDYYMRFDGMQKAEEYVRYAKEKQPCYNTQRGWYDVYDVCDDSIVNIGRAVIDEGYTSFNQWSARLKYYLLAINNQFTNENIHDISVNVWDCSFEESKDKILKIKKIAKRKRNLFLRIIQSKASIYLSIALIIISQLHLSFGVNGNYISVGSPLIIGYIIPVFYELITMHKKRRYYLIPLIMIVINIIYLFITHFFILYIPDIKFLFVRSSALLVVSSIILAFNNEDFTYKYSVNYQKSTF